MRLFISMATIQAMLLQMAAQAADGAPTPDYLKNVAPLLKKYCAGCHNAADKDGELAVDSFAELMRGGEHGPAVLPGDPESSRLIRLISGAAEPRMPPEGEPAPSEGEIAVLVNWIEAGAKGPDGEEPDRLSLMVPEIPTHTDTRPIASVDVSPDGKRLAVARFARVTVEPYQWIDASGLKPSAEAVAIGEYPGKVNAVHFDATGEKLITASGVTGLGGVAAIWNVADGKLVREFKGHYDVLYDAELSPDGGVLATCSYDKEIILWDAATGEELRRLSGHNGAVYDVAFSPDGAFLASASADDTCKVWRVSDGERMDTLGQPLKEQYSVEFSPNGRLIVSGGADNRIRVWRFVSKNRPRINPLRFARFAHEGAVLQTRFTPDGSRLISIADDRTVKVWETRTFTEIHLQTTEALAQALAVASNDRFLLGSMEGGLTSLTIPETRSGTTASPQTPVAVAPVEMDEEPMTTLSEAEPNNDPANANAVDAPAQINGVISGRYGDDADFDLFRFQAHAREEWVVEVNAARSKSPLDSFVEVLDASGAPIERVLLQAVRDSYFTFRGKDANTISDFRLFNWEEMELNEYLYADGEVVKLHLYPRGPDSGFNVYPGTGKRWGYFDTTPLAHALGAPCYIVRPHPPGSELIPNGLPVFTLYYENDDEGMRSMSRDSKLYFTAPADGEYLVRIRDVRGLEGEDYRYRLSVRPRKPDFRVTLHNTDPKVPPGGCREFRVSAKRMDGYDRPISVDVTGLPPGFTASTPVVIQAGQLDAHGVLRATADAPKPTEQNQMISVTMATATIRGEEVSHPSTGFGKITLMDELKASGRIVAAKGGAVPVAAPEDGPLEFEIAPGETIRLKVVVDRPNNKGEVSFGKEYSGRNLPHGLYVDNIGLNGLLLLDGQQERDFFITAAKWVPEQSRLFHLQSGANGGIVTPPVLLHVREKDEPDR